MDEDALLNAAGRIADGDQVDWASITSSLNLAVDREVADELAIVAQIAAGHRQLHELLPSSPSTPTDLIPDRARWGHLDLLNIVGRGSYGIVYRAWDTRLERLVALKLFHGAARPDAVMEEGRMLARVRHENVVAVYGADVIDGVAGIWMELVHGRTLDTVVHASGPLSARETAAVGIDIARALTAVHAAGLLHCDVKAQNVVRESGGRVVLMDFGAGRLAPEMRDEDQSFDVAGTPRYMAPELFATGASATRESDVYSLGVLVYFLVSGKYPVEGRTFSELRRAHEAGVSRSLRDLNPALPAALIDAVAGATEPDPAKRFDSAAKVQAMLVSAVTAPDVTPPAQSVRWQLVVSALALLALVSAMWLTRPLPAALFAPNSIAVMPLRNLTGEPAMQSQTDAVTETVVAHLARIPGLEVASPERVTAARASSEFEREIATTLRVRYLLVGSIVQSDGRIRINVMLNDPRAGRTVAATEIERTSSTLLSVRSEVAKWVALRLGLTVPPDLE